MKLKVATLILSIAFMTSIVKCTQEKRLLLDARTFEKINTLCPNINSHDLIIYYFDGDCSICLAKVSYIEKLYGTHKNFKIIFIARTFNPDILKYHLADKKISSCVYFEKNNEFEKMLKFGNVIKLYQDHFYSDVEIK